MVTLKKATVTLGDIPLAASRPITWMLTTGTRPYVTEMQVHDSQWTQMKRKLGDEVDLVIKDSRGRETTIEAVTPLHEVASDSPYRRSFLVADRRWKWDRKFVHRDYNIPRRSGTRTSVYDMPFPGSVTVDEFIYKKFSLKDGTTRWTAKDAVEDMLEVIEPGNWEVDEFPIEGDDELGAFSLQDITIRDTADVALGRLLSYIPGAEIYIGIDGEVKLIDATDLDAAEKHLEDLEHTTWDGDYARKIDRRQIRPKKIYVYYQREIEAVFDFEDDWTKARTSADYDPESPFLENVIPTVDPTSSSVVYDVWSDSLKSFDVAQGTYLEASFWLEAMDALAASGPLLPWTFETVQTFWVAGNLEGALGARQETDDVEDGNIASRVAALRSHFRRTFRINGRYMDRIRSIRPTRVGILQPFTGTRAPSPVWGQATMVVSTKGQIITNHYDENGSRVFRPHDYLKPNVSGGTPLNELAPGPARLSILDPDQGIIHAEWYVDPYGLAESYIPCLLSNKTVNEEQSSTPVGHGFRDLALQDTDPIAMGAHVEDQEIGLYLSSFCQMKTMLTIVPGAPNNKNQYQRIEVDARDVDRVYRKEFRIRDGEGPPLEVFIPPGEATARFALAADEVAAEETIKKLLGVDSDDINDAGIEPEEGGEPGSELLGYNFLNYESEIEGHAKSVAAAHYAAYADAIQGDVTSVVPKDVELKGNVSSVSIRVAQAPDGSVAYGASYPGQQKPVSHFALLPNETRKITLGILAFKVSGDE